jgi:hypothetical protein
MARAVRDHLADCTHTLPTLIDYGRDASLHFFIANLGAMRKQLFPALELAYRQWLDGGDRAVFRDLAARGADHWRSLAEQMMDLHRREAEASAAQIARTVEAAAL